MRKIILILALLLLPSFAWWNSNWTYEREISAPNGKGILYFDLDTETLVNQTKVQVNCNDIRIIDNSENEQQLWIDENYCNTTSTRIYWKPTNTSETNFSLYYGNPTATDIKNFSIFEGNLFNDTSFEQGTSGNRADYWDIGYQTAVFDYNDSISYVGSQSLYLDGFDPAGRAWSGKETISTITDNVVYEVAINAGKQIDGNNLGVYLVGEKESPQPTLLHLQILENSTIRIVAGSTPDMIITNQTVHVNHTGWDSIRALVNFSTDKVKVWINQNYAGDFEMREYDGEVNALNSLGFFAETNKNEANFDAIRLYTNIETLSIGDERTQNGLFFSYTPDNPNVFENILFEADEGAYNITRWWWDFGDNSSIVSTVVNSTTHFFTNGGIFTVNLTGLNGTTSNISVSRDVSVFEPTITIWANDSSNDILISNFSVLAENSTTSKQFNSSGFSATWNFTLGPFGNVSILILKDGYNSTREYITISNSSDITFTATVLPSIYRFYPKDVDYGNTIVPVTISMHNLTSIIEKESDWEKIFSHTNTQNGIGTSVTYSDNYTGQIWKIYAKSTSSDGSATVNISFFLFSQDLSFSKRIFSAVALGTSNDFEKTRYVFLKKDGTYKILDESQVVESSGAFPYFPAKIRAKNYAHIASGGNTCSAKSEISQPNEYLEFQQPNDALVGNVSVDFQQLTDGYFGFLENTYSNNKLSFRRVTTRNFFNQTVYLLSTSASKEVKVSTVDRGENAISDTLVVFSIFREGSWKVFASGVTDGTGIVKFKLDQDETYLVTLAHSGYSPQAFTITQPESEYKFYLSDQFNFFDSPLDNLGISLTPFDTSLYSNNSYWFNYTVVDGNLQTDYIKLDLFDENETLLFSDTSSGNPNGGVISTYLTVTNQTRIFANMSVKQFSEDEITITREYIVFDVNVSVISLSSILPDFQDANSSSGWYIIVLILTMILSALHPLIGIAFLFVLVFAHVLELYIAIVGLFAVIGGIVIKGGI